VCNWRGLAFYNVVLHQRTAVWPSCKENRTWLWLKPCLCLLCLFHIFLLISGKSYDTFIVTFIRERDVHVFKCSVALHGLRLWLKLQSYWALSLRIHVLWGVMSCHLMSYSGPFESVRESHYPLPLTMEALYSFKHQEPVTTQHNDLEDLNL